MIFSNLAWHNTDLASDNISSPDENSLYIGGVWVETVFGEVSEIRSAVVSSCFTGSSSKCSGQNTNTLWSAFSGVTGVEPFDSHADTAPEEDGSKLEECCLERFLLAAAVGDVALLQEKTEGTADFFKCRWTCGRPKIKKEQLWVMSQLFAYYNLFSNIKKEMPNLWHHIFLESLFLWNVENISSNF